MSWWRRIRNFRITRTSVLRMPWLSLTLRSNVRFSAGRVCQVRICTAHCFDMAVACTERVPRKTRVAEAENNWVHLRMLSCYLLNSPMIELDMDLIQILPYRRDWESEDNEEDFRTSTILWRMYLVRDFYRRSLHSCVSAAAMSFPAPLIIVGRRWLLTVQW